MDGSPSRGSTPAPDSGGGDSGIAADSKAGYAATPGTTDGGHAAQFTGRSYIEIQNSAGALDLDKNFTIEMSAKWHRPDATDVLAGDEAWPSMSNEVPVVGEHGWTLRKHRVDNQNIIDFTVGSDQSWLSLTAPIPANSYARFHVAICRHDDDLTMFLNGRRVGDLSVAGKKLLNSPSPMYLGVRKHAWANRTFEGQIRGFHASAAASTRRILIHPTNSPKTRKRWSYTTSWEPRVVVSPTNPEITATDFWRGGLVPWKKSGG